MFARRHVVYKFACLMLLVLSTYESRASLIKDEEGMDLEPVTSVAAPVDTELARTMSLPNLQSVIEELKHENSKYKKYMNSSDDELFQEQLQRRETYLRIATVLEPISDIMIFGSPVAISFAQGLGAGTAWIYSFSGVGVLGAFLKKLATYFSNESWRLRKNAMKKSADLNSNIVKLEGILAQRQQAAQAPSDTAGNSSNSSASTTANLKKKNIGSD